MRGLVKIVGEIVCVLVFSSCRQTHAEASKNNFVRTPKGLETRSKRTLQLWKGADYEERFRMRAIAAALMVVSTLIVATVSAEEISRPTGLNGSASVSVNAGPCVYDTVAEAMADASDGDNILIRPGYRAEFIGKIDRDVTLIRGFPGSRGNTGCKFLTVTVDPASLTFDAETFSNDTNGGMAEVLAERTVTSFLNGRLRGLSARCQLGQRRSLLGRPGARSGQSLSPVGQSV